MDVTVWIESEEAIREAKEKYVEVSGEERGWMFALENTKPVVEEVTKEYLMLGVKGKGIVIYMIVTAEDILGILSKEASESG